jgi:hypothetical protein
MSARENTLFFLMTLLDCEGVHISSRRCLLFSRLWTHLFQVAEALPIYWALQAFSYHGEDKNALIYHRLTAGLSFNLISTLCCRQSQLDFTINTSCSANG